MNKKLRQDAIEQYRNRKGALDWNPLMDYASTILELRDKIEESLPEQEFNREIAKKAVSEEKPYLSLDPIVIDPIAFRKNCQQLFNDFTEKGIISAENANELSSVDWNNLSEETINLAGKDPEAFFMNASRELLKDSNSEIAPVVLAGILLTVVRAYLDKTGEQMTELLSRQDEVVVKSRPINCPTCGEKASLSSVIEGSDSQGAARRLFCTCCGTVWQYERVRCGFCGTTNSNKLDYIYADEDPAHRLHVCSECHGALPTVFQEALGGTMDFDVEQTASSIIQSLYAEKVSKEE